MVRSHSICFHILLTNKHNLAHLLCDCFFIIHCSESLVTGMAYLQLGFCPTSLASCLTISGLETMSLRLFSLFFQNKEPEKLLTLMSFPLKTYVKNRQDTYMLDAYWAALFVRGGSRGRDRGCAPLPPPLR